MRAVAQRIYVSMRVEPPDRPWVGLSLGAACALLGLVVLEPRLFLAGVAMALFSLILHALTSWTRATEEEAERLRFSRVVPDVGGLPAWRQVLAYAVRRSSEDAHPKVATVVGAIFLFAGMFVPGAYDTQESPGWFLPGFGAAGVITPWLLEWIGAAIMREPEGEDWDRVWQERVLVPAVDKQAWRTPGFWLQIVLLVAVVFTVLRF